MLDVFALSYRQDACGQTTEIDAGYVWTLAEAEAWKRLAPGNSFAPARINQEDAWQVACGE
jgi:hypothetical protein